MPFFAEFTGISVQTYLECEFSLYLVDVKLGHFTVILEYVGRTLFLVCIRISTRNTSKWGCLFSLFN